MPSCTTWSAYSAGLSHWHVLFGENLPRSKIGDAVYAKFSPSNYIASVISSLNLAYINKQEV